MLAIDYVLNYFFIGNREEVDTTQNILIEECDSSSEELKGYGVYFSLSNKENVFDFFEMHGSRDKKHFLSLMLFDSVSILKNGLKIGGITTTFTEAFISHFGTARSVAEHFGIELPEEEDLLLAEVAVTTEAPSPPAMELEEEQPLEMANPEGEDKGSVDFQKEPLQGSEPFKLDNEQHLKELESIVTPSQPTLNFALEEEEETRKEENPVVVPQESAKEELLPVEDPSETEEPVSNTDEEKVDPESTENLMATEEPELEATDGVPGEEQESSQTQPEEQPEEESNVKVVTQNAAIGSQVELANLLSKNRKEFEDAVFLLTGRRINSAVEEMSKDDFEQTIQYLTKELDPQVMVKAFGAVMKRFWRFGETELVSKFMGELAIYFEESAP